ERERPQLAVDGGARGRHQGRVALTTNTGRWSDRPERAVLVGVDFSTRPPATRAGLEGARRAASRRAEDDSTDAENAPARAADGPGLDADESLADFRELV